MQVSRIYMLFGEGQLEVLIIIIITIITLTHHPEQWSKHTNRPKSEIRIRKEDLIQDVSRYWKPWKQEGKKRKKVKHTGASTEHQLIKGELKTGENNQDRNQ